MLRMHENRRRCEELPVSFACLRKLSINGRVRRPSFKYVQYLTGRFATQEHVPSRTASATKRAASELPAHAQSDNSFVCREPSL